MSEQILELTRDYGDLAARVNRLEQDVTEIKSDVRVIRDTVVEAKGGWKVVALFGAFCASVGALVLKIWEFLGRLQH